MSIIKKGIKAIGKGIKKVAKFVKKNWKTIALVAASVFLSSAEKARYSSSLVVTTFSISELLMASCRVMEFINRDWLGMARARPLSSPSFRCALAALFSISGWSRSVPDGGKGANLL